MTFHPNDLGDLSDRVYVVTGATGGIGYYTTARLAEHHAHVYLCARTKEQGDTTRSRIQSTYHNARLSILVMDHTRLSTVVTAAKEFCSSETRLDGLVNNAGIMATPFALTNDGYEEQWQTNYLAHWVLTWHLLPMMLQTSLRADLAPGRVRIVNLSSSGHYWAPKDGINFTDIALEASNGMARYGQSKLANVLHSGILHKLFGPGSLSSIANRGELWVSTVHPGLVKSGLDIAPYRWVGGEINADKGSWTTLFCVAGAAMKRNDCGKYWQRMTNPNGWQSASSEDLGLAERLEEWTAKTMGEGGWIEMAATSASQQV
ncbi:putative carbonyl reductase [Paraphoma chrysanthemicola]|uniref:Carbonyl reductase n=1 Tax=Paraphoma chrysanthemicola TaxID=798071 RepID=A0A8K0VWR6_9PLEO|nr:putative carbonyl reductase [Paraphoma chrysanthemicola]